MSINKSAIQQIVSVFETGKALGDYTSCSILSDGAGISYGLHQATDAGGNLDKIVLRYLDIAPPSRLTEKLESYLDELQANATIKQEPGNPEPWAQELMQLLRELGKEPFMQRAQNEIFDEAYWIPCKVQCEAMGLQLSLSWLAVYDTCIHSGPNGVAKMRNLFNQLPPIRGGDEKEWTQAYVTARHVWLANFTGRSPAHTALVRKCVYRTTAMQKLIDAKNWNLTPPFLVRGQAIQ